MKRFNLPVKRWGKHQRNKTFVSIHVEPDKILYDGQDLGPDVSRLAPGADSDYEYKISVKAEYKDAVLLELLKQHLPDDAAFRTWLKDKDIPYEFWSY